MRRKHFYVVTYDIGDDKRRAQVVKLMESIGTRMNYSVFECMLTDIQYKSMCKRLAKIVVRKEDWVNNLSTMYRMLCPYRVYSSCQKEGTGENRNRLVYCRAFFGLLIHQNYLRKFDFQEKPHFEGFSESRRNRQCENSSRIKKTEKRLTIFAPDEIGVFEADFSQESNWRQTRKSFANFWS